MNVTIRRRRRVDTRPELVEIVTPRTNAASISAAENLFASVSRSEPFGLEIAATRDIRWFLARTASASMRLHLEHQLAAVYPQAELRRLDLDRHPHLDPARANPVEQVAACAMVLDAPGYLPIRIFHDGEVAADRAPQADPILGILGALSDLPEHWRALVQLIVHPAPDTWCAGYLRLTVEHPLTQERTEARTSAMDPSMLAMLALMGVGALAFQGYQWYSASDWLHLGLGGAGVAGGIPAALWLASRLNRHPIYDMKLVQEKVSRIAYCAQLRLAVFAPSGSSRVRIEEQLHRLAAAYRQFSLAAGNGFTPRVLRPEAEDLVELRPLIAARALPVLNTRELAGLWHLPQGLADVALVERTTARQRLPLPFTVARGCRIGEAVHQGRTVPVALPDDLLQRHLLLVAKTRRGKSSLLLRLAAYLMESRSQGGTPRGVVVVDPHRDLAEAALGIVPEHRRQDVVYLNVGERERPFGLNLIDVGLGWDIEQAVANTIAIFRQQFDKFWGPRMENAFRFALLTLIDANRTICAADPDGRGRQYTILDIPALFSTPPFRRSVLALVKDPIVRAWWPTHWDTLDRRLQLDIPNPVITKVQRFTGSHVARRIVGQPRSTIEPAAWVRSGAIVIVNTAKGAIGEDTAALIGATLLNLVALGVEEQAKLDATSRRRVTMLVDEFHTMPGADYEAIVSELAKYGANLVLATQSLAQLGVLDRTQDRALRAKLFANLDGLVAFQTSAEDARYLVPELGEGVDIEDLIELPDHQCYVRLNSHGEQLPTFSVRLDPPPRSDSSLRDELAKASAARYGRSRALIDADLESALARVERLRQGTADPAGGGVVGTGVERDGGSGGQIRVSARSEHRPPKKDVKDKKGGTKGRESDGQLPLPNAADPQTPDVGSDPTPEAQEGEAFGDSGESAA